MAANGNGNANANAKETEELETLTSTTPSFRVLLPLCESLIARGADPFRVQQLRGGPSRCAFVLRSAETEDAADSGDRRLAERLELAALRGEFLSAETDLRLSECRRFSSSGRPLSAATAEQQELLLDCCRDVQRVAASFEAEPDSIAVLSVRFDAGNEDLLSRSTSEQREERGERGAAGDERSVSATAAGAAAANCSCSLSVSRSEPVKLSFTFTFPFTVTQNSDDPREWRLAPFAAPRDERDGRLDSLDRSSAPCDSGIRVTLLALRSLCALHSHSQNRILHCRLRVASRSLENEGALHRTGNADRADAQCTANPRGDEQIRF